MNDKVALFASTLLNSATNAHFFHWSTESFSKHDALGDYYDAVVPAVDKYIEVYMGIYERITKFPPCPHEPKDPIVYFKSLQKFVKEARSDLPKDTQLINLCDGIAELIDSTVYKLVNLK